MRSEKILVTNIQRFSLHDGPGIRTTVFLKGRSLRCPWCSNPENIEHRIQEYLQNDVRGQYGEWKSSDEIFREIIKDAWFYGKYEKNSDSLCPISLDDLPGGVTFSGGEALLFAEQLEDLLKRLKSNGIHIAVETGLFISEKLLRIGAKYIDLFYVDIKMLIEEECTVILHGNVKQYFRNLSVLCDLQANVIFRIPVIGGYTDNMKNQDEAVLLIKKMIEMNLRILRIELLKGHNLAESKYLSLSMPVPEYQEVPDEMMEIYKKRFDDLGVDCEI